MALFNEILTGRYNGILRKLLNMKEGAPSPTLATDISPGITLESDRPEFAFLGGEFRCMAGTTKAALAGNNAYVGIFNGQATGMLVVVRAFWILNATAGALEFQLRVGNTTGLTGTLRGVATDLRWAGKQSAALVGSGTEAAPTGSPLGQIGCPANTTQVYATPFEIILPPNSNPTVAPLPNFVIETDLVNTGIKAGFVWTERPLENSETR